jgi:Na+/proline symporter
MKLENLYSFFSFFFLKKFSPHFWPLKITSKITSFPNFLFDFFGEIFVQKKGDGVGGCRWGGDAKNESHTC